MIFRIVSFGHRRDEFFALTSAYAKRVRKPWGIEFVDHPSGRKAETESGAQVMAREAAALTQRPYWVLAVEADQLTSESLARLLAKTSEQQRELTLVIGGADGLDPSVTAKAGRRLSLSRLTLPHRLARLVLVEQIYRAQSILNSSPYHK